MMKDKLSAYLHAKVHLSEDEMNQILHAFHEKKLRKHQYLLQEGNVSKQIAFVTKGCLRLYRVDEKDVEHIVQFAFENWWMSDRESYVTGMPSNYHIDAIEDSEVLLCDIDTFNQLGKSIQPLGDLMQSLQSKNFVSVQRRINAALSYTAEQKYQELLTFQPEILQRVPLAMVASYLGITRETLSRIRNQAHKKLT